MKLLVVLTMLSLAGFASAQSTMGTTSPSAAPVGTGSGTIGNPSGTTNSDSTGTRTNQQRMEDTTDMEDASSRDTSNMNSTPATTPSSSTITP